MSFIMIYTTHPTMDHAKRVVNDLMDKKLIACANVSTIDSFYRWKGNIENEGEILTILKTSDANRNKVQKRIIEIHEYETPCIIKINVEANSSYEKWIDEEIV